MSLLEMDYYIGLHLLSLVTNMFPQSELNSEVVHFVYDKHNFPEGKNFFQVILPFFSP